MINQAPHLIPSIYLANYLNEFEDIIRKYDIQKKKMGKRGISNKIWCDKQYSIFYKKWNHTSFSRSRPGKKVIKFFWPRNSFSSGS